MNVPEKYREYDELLKTKLDNYRYIHSLGVAKSARHLAELYGGDAEKAYFAGLMHDVMKNASPDEQLQIIKKAGQTDVIGQSFFAMSFVMFLA